MNENLHPDLLRGAVPLGGPTTTRVGTGMGAIARSVGADGKMDVPVINGQGILPRNSYMDAEQLLDAIAEIVEAQVKPLREEIRVLRNKLKLDAD